MSNNRTTIAVRELDEWVKKPKLSPLYLTQHDSNLTKKTFYVLESYVTLDPAICQFFGLQPLSKANEEPTKERDEEEGKATSMEGGPGADYRISKDWRAVPLHTLHSVFSSKRNMRRSHTVTRKPTRTIPREIESSGVL